jgi:pseudaminic acid biosynthesis-associated methylase
MRTEDFWSGSFGDTYTERNRVDWRQRIPFWESALDFMAPGTMLEVGCNAGWNLMAIQTVNPDVEVQGVDVNAKAVAEASANGCQAQQLTALGVAGMFIPKSMDCVFTAGVLIHIAPNDLEATMRAIVQTSGKYVLAIEYDAEMETEVEYRGHKGKLWKRPYGKLYENLGMTLLSTGVAGGFDDCTYWLMERTGQS